VWDEGGKHRKEINNKKLEKKKVKKNEQKDTDIYKQGYIGQFFCTPPYTHPLKTSDAELILLIWHWTKNLKSLWQKSNFSFLMQASKQTKKGFICSRFFATKQDFALIASSISFTFFEAEPWAEMFLS
jgi:hypothetical protein